MEYTQNYHLPQWDETDRIMLPDFNAAMAAIETGLTATQTAAANALTGLGSGGQNCRIECGSHIGDGTSPWVTLTVDFYPVMVVIFHTETNESPGIMIRGSETAAVRGDILQPIIWGDTSVKWQGYPNAGSGFNGQGRKYVYVVLGF